MQAEVEVPPRCPRSLLVGTYLLYLGLTSSASVPLFADIDWLHEGERLGSAQVILSGGLPIRDVYLPHGFLPEAVKPLLAFWLFGESLASDRLMGLLLAPLPYVAAVFYLWRLFPWRFWRIVGLTAVAFYPLLLLPRHVVVLLSLGLLTEWTRQPRRGLLVGAGMLAGLGFVLSTIDQALFLLTTVFLVPFTMALERWSSSRSVRPETDGDRHLMWGTSRDIVSSLYLGVAAGLLPFLGYLALTGTGTLFVSDLFRRTEADAYAFIHVHQHTSFPPLSPENAVWYAVPLFYASLGILITARVFRQGDRSWSPLLPTLLFGMISFVYAVRQFTYWKLAVVSFPFVVGVVYLLAMTEQDWTRKAGRTAQPTCSAEAWGLLGLTGFLMAVLLIQAFTRDWKPKQIAPRYLFPALAVTVMATAATAASGRLSGARRREIALVCPVAALVVSVWFYTDAKPQVLSAQIKKPKFIREAGHLASSFAHSGGHLTRESPPYFQDEVLTYLVEKRQEGRPVVILAPGAGVYYFQADVAPPNRFPHVELALAEVWAQEVVQSLERTKAELLVSCRDNSHSVSVTGWPMQPLLSAFILAHYRDSGRRLQSVMQGEACPFSVWVRHDGAGGQPIDERT